MPNSTFDKVLEGFIKELGIVTSVRELGATKEMLPLIVNKRQKLSIY